MSADIGERGREDRPLTRIVYAVGRERTYALIEWDDPTGLFEHDLTDIASAHPDDLGLDIPDQLGVWQWSGALEMSGGDDPEPNYIGQWARLCDLPSITPPLQEPRS